MACKIPIVGLAREIKRDGLIEGQACQHGLRPRVEPPLQAGCGRHLYSVLFVGRLQESPTQAVSDGQVWLGAPGILHIGLEFMVDEMTQVGSAVRQGLTGGGEVIALVDFGNNARQYCYRVVVGIVEAK